MTVLTLEQSNQIRKQQAKPTGEAYIARKFSKIFAEHNPSKAQHRFEFEGLKGVVDVTADNRRIKSNALFWYEGDRPRITLFIAGAVKVVSLIGKKDRAGKYTKFSVLESRVKPGSPGFKWLTEEQTT